MQIENKKKMSNIFLKKGDLVDIISPASPLDKNELTKIQNYLKKFDLKSRFYLEDQLILNKKNSNNFSVFSPEIRFAQLDFALTNNESNAVWCARGGYGTLELIPYFSKLKNVQDKIFIGFSDITTIGIFLNQKLNQEIIYGPMLKQLSLNLLNEKSEKNIFDLAFGKVKNLKYKLKNLTNLSQDKIEGILVGGCLSVIAANFNTENEINWRDKILLLEDIDESGEKIDRYFEQFLQIMTLKKSFPKAILLGNFKQDLKNKIKEKNIDIAIDNFAKKIKDKKIDCALYQEKSGSLGHSKHIAPIILGKITTIQNDELSQML